MFRKGHPIENGSDREAVHWNLPKTSDSRNMNTSSSPRDILVPPYSGRRTLSPALRVGMCKVPVTSRSPGPTATTSPSFGSFVESVGM